MNAQPSAQRLHVLIIDDDPLVRELLYALLSAEQDAIDTIETADSGEAGLASVAEGSTGSQPHVILADMQLPGISGAALAAELHRACPGAILLGMSGSEPKASDRSAFDAFLLKPFSTADFEAAISTARSSESPSPSPATESRAERSAQGGPAALDEATYLRLAAALPPAALSELYRLSLEDVALRLDRMRDAQTAQDLDTYRREAHALKGGCSMVGAMELAALAAIAESADRFPAGSSGCTGNATFGEYDVATARLRSMIAARSTLQREPT